MAYRSGLDFDRSDDFLEDTGPVCLHVKHLRFLINIAKRRKPWGSSQVQKESPNQRVSQISANGTTKKFQRIRHRLNPTSIRKAISLGVKAPSHSFKKTPSVDRFIFIK